MESRQVGFGALTVAIIAAVVGGIFTLLPMVFDHVNNRRSLTYHVTASSPIKSESYKQIVFVKIENSGATSLTNIQALFGPGAAIFRDVSASSPIGVGAETDFSDAGIQLRIDGLNSEEAVEVSFLVEGNRIWDASDVHIRVEDLPQDQIKQGSKSAGIKSIIEDNPLGFFSGGTLFLSVYLGFGMIAFGRVRHKVFGRLDDMDREDYIGYISLLSGLGENLLAQDQVTTYVHVADKAFLLAKGGKIDKGTAVSILISLLRREKAMARASAKTVRRNLSRIDDSIDFAVLEESIPVSEDLRDDVELIFERFS